MYNVIIWGTDRIYETCFNSLKLQEVTGAIKVLAIASTDKDIKTSLDGYPVMSLEYALMLDFDYCLIAMNNAGAIIQSLTPTESAGLSRDKFIPMDVLTIPNFNFEKYITIKESKPSILSSNCWAGFCYHRLGLDFLSPTINMFFNCRDFNKFMSNLDYYLSLPVEFVEMCYHSTLKRNYPVGQIGDIQLNFNHYTDFDDAVACWEKRKKRINKNNIVAVSYTEDEEAAIEFDNLPYKNKIIFTSFKNNLKSSIYISLEINSPLWGAVNATASGDKNMLDLLSFLNHEDIFIRYT